MAEFDPTPESLRDTAVLEERIADIRRDLGQSSAAFEGYVTRKALASQILQEYGPTPERLRDLSVSQAKIAGMLRRHGKRIEALQSYEESLRFRQQIIEDYGSTPDRDRDVVEAIQNVDNLKQDQATYRGNRFSAR